MLDTIYFNNSLRSYLIAALVVFLFILIAKLVYYLLEYPLERFVTKTKTKVDDKILDIIYLPIIFYIIIAGFYFGFDFLTFPGKINAYVDNTVKALLILNSIYFAFKILDIIMIVFLRPVVAKTKSKLDDQLIPLIQRFIKLVIAIFAIFISLENLGVDMVSLLTGLGIGGIAVALAAKDSLSNLFGSLSVVMDQPFYIGDIVRFKDYEGVVIDLGIRSTRIRTFDTTEITIPNSELTANTIENISKRKAVKKVIDVKLSSKNTAKNLERAKVIIEKILEKEMGILKEYYVALIGFDIWGFDMKIVYWVKYNGSYKPYLEVRHRLHSEIVKNLEKAKIPLAFR